MVTDEVTALGVTFAPVEDQNSTSAINAEVALMLVDTRPRTVSL
jgi:hypothetical protein